MAQFRAISDHVLQLALDPLQGVNCYLVPEGDGHTLIDAGGKLDARRIIKALRGRTLVRHVVTHVHPDHQGSSHAVCTEYDLPFIVPAGEERQAEAGTFEGLSGDSRRARVSARVFGGPGHPVAATIEDGDSVGDFVAVALPGHTPGQLGFWHEQSRTLICGDGLRNMSFATGRPGIRLPPDYFTVDPAEAKLTAAKIREMRPELIAFGHGRPARGADSIAEQLATLV